MAVRLYCPYEDIQGLTIKQLIHSIAIRVADLGVDEPSTSLSEDYASHSAGLFGGFDDVLGRFHEGGVDIVVWMQPLELSTAVQRSAAENVQAVAMRQRYE